MPTMIAKTTTVMTTQMMMVSRVARSTSPENSSSGVAMASGVRHYLWHHANTSFSWWGDNLANLPPPGGAPPSSASDAAADKNVMQCRAELDDFAFDLDGADF